MECESFVFLCVSLQGAGKRSTVWSESSEFNLPLIVGWYFDLGRIFMYYTFHIHEFCHLHVLNTVLQLHCTIKKHMMTHLAISNVLGLYLSQASFLSHLCPGLYLSKYMSQKQLKGYASNFSVHQKKASDSQDRDFKRMPKFETAESVKLQKHWILYSP